jgi:hypothetical protein
MFDLQLPLELGLNLETYRPLFFELALFALHFHLIGATGSGKTSALEALLYQLWLNADPRQCFIIVDTLGGFSYRLLRFIANPELCPESIRERTVYFEPAHEQYSTTMHPLTFATRLQMDFSIERAMDLILRGFETQMLSAMPRLRLWLYRCIFGLALLGYPLAFARYLLHPRSREHSRLLAMLPPEEQVEWQEIMKDSRGQAAMILEAARNRISMINDYRVLQRFFGSPLNRFDIGRFMDEGRIVILNLSPGDRRLSFQAGAMIGSMVTNEVLNCGLARYATTKKPNETFLVIDEFQRLLGPDIYDFLPIVRNTGIRLILANQSFSQLIKGDVDLRPLIAQARTRLMFANDFLDADILAEEVANLKWNPDEIKRQYESYRQRIAGYEKIVTQSWGNTSTRTNSWTHQDSQTTGVMKPEDYWQRRGSTSEQRGSADGSGGGHSEADNRGYSEHFLPIHEEFSEIVRVEYRSREEVVHKWRKYIRQQQTGECLAKLANDPELYRVLVNYLPQYDDPQLDRAVEEFVARNYEEGPFITAEEADRELEQIRQKLLTGPKIIVPSITNSVPQTQPTKPKDPFRA